MNNYFNLNYNNFLIIKLLLFYIILKNYIIIYLILLNKKNV